MIIASAITFTVDLLSSKLPRQPFIKRTPDKFGHPAIITGQLLELVVLLLCDEDGRSPCF